MVITIILTCGIIVNCITKLIFKGAKNIGILKRKVEQIDKSDFIFDKEYYRDILKDSSPLLLSYLDNFEIKENDIIAEILYMKEKGIILIDDEKIVVNPDINSKLLISYEKHIIKKIVDGKLEAKNLEEFLTELCRLVAKEAEYRGLLEDVKKINSNKLHVMLVIIGYILVIITYILLTKVFLIFDEMIVSFIFVPIICLYLPINLLLIWGYKQGKETSQYKRSSRGIELNNKIDGLKKYLSDFSMLSERESKDIVLWEEYLIYSVLFGQNKKIVEEYNKYIERDNFFIS